MKKKPKQQKTKKENEVYRTVTLMFPPNHNDIINVVCGGFEPKTGKAQTFIEHNFPNAYLKRSYTDIAQHNTKEKMLEVIRELVNKLNGEIQNQKVKNHFESEETFFVSLMNYNNIESIKCPSVPINILEEGGLVAVTVLAKTKVKNKKARVVYIDVTNDPTNNYAGAVVSLGYYCWRFELKNAKIVNQNPLIMICKAKDLRRQFNKPCRRVL